MRRRRCRPLLVAQLLLRHCFRGLPRRVMALQALVTFGCVLPLLCWHAPDSAYYWRDASPEAAAAGQRRLESLVANGNAFAESLGNAGWRYADADGEGPRLSIGILAAGAGRQRLLPASLHSLLASASRQSLVAGSGVGRFASLSVTLCVVGGGNASAATRRLASAIGATLALVGDVGDDVGDDCAAAGRCLRRLSGVGNGVGGNGNGNGGADWLALIPSNESASPHSLQQLRQLIGVKLRRRYGEAASGSRRRVGLVQLNWRRDLLRYSLADASSWLELLIISGSVGLCCFCFYYRIFFNPMLLLPNLVLLLYLAAYGWLLAVCVGRPNWLQLRYALTRIVSLDAPLERRFTSALLPAEAAEMVATKLLLSPGNRGPAACDAAYEAAASALEADGRKLFAVYPSLLHPIV